MGGRKVTLTFDDRLYKDLQEEARANGFERVCAFLRCMAVQSVPSEPDVRNVLVKVNNYSEMAGYVEQKRFGEVRTFLNFAAGQYMGRYPLTEMQAERARKRGRFDCDNTPENDVFG